MALLTEQDLTEEEKRNPQNALECLLFEKERLLVLAAQVKSDGENLYANAKAKCKVELAEISRREAALAPREEDSKKREKEVSSRESSVGARETLLTQRELVFKDRVIQVDARDIDVRSREVALVDDQTRHQAKVLAETSRLKGEELIWNQRKAISDDLSAKESEALRVREKNVLESEQQIEGKKSILESLSKELEAIKAVASEDLGRRMLALEERERAVEQRSTESARVMLAAEEKEKEAHRFHADLTQQKQEQDQLARGLEKSKIDVEIQQSKVQKREILVNALIEKYNLKGDLEKLEEPLVGSSSDNLGEKIGSGGNVS